MDFWLPAAVRLHVPEKLRPKLSNDLLESVMLRYLKADCVNTFELAEFYFHQLLERHDNKTEELLNINKQVEHITWKMEITGLWVRPAELEAAQEACHHYIDTLKERTSRLSGLDHITDAQLRTLFFEEWGLEPIRLTKTGAASVDAKCLLALHEDAVPGTVQHDFLGSYLSLKKYEKKLGSLKSYHASRSSSGYTHPSFNIVGTKTTRFSSKNPNAQNITKAGNPYEDDAPDIAEWLRASPSMRSCFGPPPDMWFIGCDYSQLQLRIFAYMTQEPKLIESLEAGYDFHDTVARELFSVRRPNAPSKAQRRIAKNCVFGVLFGASERKIDATAGQPGMYKLLLSLFPSAHAFIEETKISINQIGYVETLGGYPLELKSHVNKWTGREEKAAHAGVNYIIQGAEGVIVKRAMKLCDDYFTSEYPEGRIALQVHDELLFEVPVKIPKKHVRNLTNLMESAASYYGIIAPVEASLMTHRWDKEVKILL
jgi:DNA polymerase-1